MAEPINLDYGYTPEEELPSPETGASVSAGIPLDEGYTGVPAMPTVPPEVAEQRAKKWVKGLQKPTAEHTKYLMDQILLGNEEQQELLDIQSKRRQEGFLKSNAIDSFLRDAAKRGLRAEDADMVQQIQNTSTVKTEDFYADQYAEAVVNATANAIKLTSPPTDEDFKNMDAMQRLLYLKEGVQKHAENLKAHYDATGWELQPNKPGGTPPPKIDANLERFVPLLYDARMRDSFWSLTGQNLKKQYDYYALSTNAEEALRQIKKVSNDMYEKNPEAALQFLHGFAAYTSSDQLVDNAFSVLDFGFLKPPIIPLSVYGVAVWKNTLKAHANRTVDPIKVLETQGSVDEAAKAIAGKQIERLGEVEEFNQAMSKIPGTRIEASFQDLKNHTTTLQQGAQGLEGGTYTLAREKGSRIQTDVADRTKMLDDNITGGRVKVQRLEKESQALAISGAETDRIVMLKHPNAVGRITDIRTASIDEALTSNYMRVYRIGEPADPRSLTAQGYKAEGGVSNRGMALQAANNAGVKVPMNDAQWRRFNTLIGHHNLLEAQGNKEAAAAAKKKAVGYFERVTKTKADSAEGKAFMEASGAPTPFRTTLTAANQNIRPKTPVTGTTAKKQDLERKINAISSIKTRMADDTLRPFKTVESARYSAEREIGLHPNQYEIVEVGPNQHMIEFRQAMDETNLLVRDTLAMETKQENPPGLLRLFTSVMPLSKDSKLSKNMMESAKLAGYGMKNQFEMVKAFLKPLHELKAQTSVADWDTFKGFLNEQKNFTKKVKGQPTEYGRFSKNFSELEQDYFKYTGRLPTAAEHEAYWAYVQLNDVDWVINNLGIYRDKTRQGIEMFALPRGKENLDAITPDIEGKVIHKLPFDSKVAFNYAVWNRDPEKVQFFRSDRFVKGEKQWKQQVQKRIADGELKVIHISPDAPEVLQAQYGIDMAKRGRLDYLLVEEMGSAPLPFQQLPYRPGGHRQYDYPWVARVADLHVSGPARPTVFYRGDLNHAFFNTEKEGRYYIKHFNEASKLLKAAMNSTDPFAVAAVEVYLGKHLGHSLERFKSFFKDFKGPLPLGHELRLTPSGVSTDVKYKLSDEILKKNPNWTYVRAHENPHNLYKGGVNLRYAQERGDPLHAFEMAGTKANPVYNFRPAKYLDPFVTAHRAADQLASSMLLDDVRIKAAERFVAEFSDGLAWDIGRQRADPLQALLHAPIRSTTEGVTRAEQLAIMDARRATKELIGIRTDFENGIDALQQRIIESLPKSSKEGKIAPKGVPEWAWSTITSPLQAMRTAAFHFKQGVFNVAALYNQAQAVNNIGAVLGPTHALKAASGATQGYVVRAWQDNPKMVQAFARNLEALGAWKADHFIEATNALKQTGYQRAGKEVADWNQWLKSDLTRGKFGEVLNWHTAFFRRGEEVGRYTSWYGAYSEWRAKNPTAIFDSAAKAEVLNRADFLNLSMSGVSNSVLQKGFQGLVTQFMHAHLRQAEQLWGGKLKPQEVARLLTWNSIVYGVPVGLGAPLMMGLWPVKSDVNRREIEGRFTGTVPVPYLPDIPHQSWMNPDDHVGTNIIMNGFASAAWKAALGREMDIGSSGLGGISLIRDFWNGEKPMVDNLTGVGGRTLNGVLKSMYPLYQFIATTGERELSAADFSDIMENVSTFTAAQRAWYGYTLGIYYGKNEQRIENISGAQALFTALTGTQPQAISDAMDVNNIMKHRKAAQEETRQLFTKEIIRAWSHADKDDWEGFHRHYNNANRLYQLGGFPPSERGKMQRQALDDRMPAVERSFKRFQDTIQTQKSLEAYIEFLKKRGLQ